MRRIKQIILSGRAGGEYVGTFYPYVHVLLLLRVFTDQIVFHGRVTLKTI